MLVGLGITGWHIYHILDNYFSDAFHINVSVKSASALDFPSVKICNINPVRESQLYRDFELQNALLLMGATRLEAAAKFQTKLDQLNSPSRRRRSVDSHELISHQVFVEPCDLEPEAGESNRRVKRAVANTTDQASNVTTAATTEATTTEMNVTTESTTEASNATEEATTQISTAAAVVFDPALYGFETTNGTTSQNVSEELLEKLQLEFYMSLIDRQVVLHDVAICILMHTFQ